MQSQCALEKCHAVTSLILYCGLADAAKKVSEAQEEPVKEPKTTVDEDLLRAFRYFDKTGTGSVLRIVTVMLWESFVGNWGATMHVVHQESTAEVAVCLSSSHLLQVICCTVVSMPYAYTCQVRAASIQMHMAGDFFSDMTLAP